MLRPNGRGTRFRIETYQHPPTQSPSPSNAMVRPLSGTWTGIFAAFWNLSVLEPAITLPPFVASSLAWEAMTDSGLTSSLTT
jgi:hypothetical protein